MEIARGESFFQCLVTIRRAIWYRAKKGVGSTSEVTKSFALVAERKSFTLLVPSRPGKRCTAKVQLSEFVSDRPLNAWPCTVLSFTVCPVINICTTEQLVACEPKSPTKLHTLSPVCHRDIPLDKSQDDHLSMRKLWKLLHWFFGNLSPKWFLLFVDQKPLFISTSKE